MRRVYTKHFPAIFQAIHQPKFKWVLLVFGAVASILLLIVVLNLINAGRTRAAWFDDTFQYRQKVEITNSGSAQTEFQVSITLNTSTLISNGKMQADCDDIRITDNNGKLLPHVIEEGSAPCNNASTKIWTKIPSILTTGQTLYIYYGNSVVQTAEDGRSVFDFFDDFNTNTLSSSSWLATGGTTLSGGALTITTGSVYSRSTVLPDARSYMYEYRTQWAATAVSYAGMIINNTTSATGNNGESDKLIYMISDAAASIQQRGFAADGTVASYNLVSNAGLYTPTANTYYVDGYSMDATQIKFWNNGSQTGSTVTGSWTAPPFIWLGYYTGSTASTTNITDITVDWVRARKYAATAPSAGSPSGEEKTPSPVGYWKLDEGTNNTCVGGTNDACNAMGNTSLDGSVNGAPVWQTEDQCISGKCLFFDGVDDSVSVADNDLLEAGTDFSVGAWFTNTDTDTTAESYIAGKYNSSNSTWLLGKRVNVNGDFGFQVRTAAGVNASALVPSQQYNDGKWHYAMGVKSGTTVYLYVDGQSVASGSHGSLTTTSGSAAMYIGSHDGTIPWTGKIDELKTYNYARSATQVKSDYIRGAADGGSSAVLGAQDTSYLNNGLVGYWKMDETSWATNCSTASVLDASGNGNNGKPCPNGSAPTVAVGKFGNAGSFDGTDDYVDIPNHSSLNPSDAITFSAWMYQTSNFDDYQTVLMKPFTGSVGGNEQYFIQRDQTTDNIIVGIKAGGSMAYATSTTTWASTLNTWTHIAGVYDGQTLRIYVNGTNERTTSKTGTLDSDTVAVGIGGHSNSAYYKYAGKVDETRIYNRALSNKEVSNLYNWAPGPVGQWKMDENTGPTANDTSGNGNTGTLNGQPLWGPGKFSSAVDFSTSSHNITVPANSSLNQLPAMTGEAWIYPRSLGGASLARIFNKSNSNGWIFFLKSGPNLGFFMRFDGGTSALDATSSGGNLTLNQWNHVAFTWDGTSSTAGVAFYINGVKVVTTGSNPTGSRDNDSTYDFLIGNSDNGARVFDGYIDDARMYNYPRTAKQVVEDMNGGHPTGGSPVGSMIAHWGMDQGADNTCSGETNDACNSGSLGLSLDGAQSGMAVPSASNSGWLTTGKVNKALSFDGINDRVVVNDNDALDFGTGNFSVSTWIKTSNTASQYIAEKDISGCTNASWLLGTSIGTAGKVYAIIGTTSTSCAQESFQSQTTVTDGNWHHIVLIRNAGGTNQLYVDGKLDSIQIDQGGSTTNSQQLTIGTHYDDASTYTGFFDGQLDEVKIYNYSLSQDDIRIDMNAGASANFGTGSASESTLLQDVNGSSPLAYWKLDENTGTVASDSTNNGNTGALTSGATWEQGKYNSGTLLDGINDHVLVNDSNSLDITGDFTISAWVKKTGTGNMQVVSKTGAAASGGYAMLVGNQGELYCRTDNGTTYVDSFTNYTGYVPNGGGWKFLTIARTGTSCRVYVDGVDRTSTAGTHTTLTANALNLTIGARADLSIEFWKGTIDDVKIYTYGRTPAQIAYDYNGGPPIAYWNLDEGKGISTVYDSSGQGNTGTMTSFDHRSWGPGKIGSGLIFNGANYVQASGLLGSPSTVTLEAWVNPTAYDSSGGEVISLGDYVVIRVNTTLISAFYYNGTAWSGPSFAMVPTNQWHHIVFVANPGASTQKLYIDGVLRSSLTMATAISWAGLGSNTFIGKHGNAGTVFDYSGTIDDVKIYNYERTPAQVAYDYNRGKALVHYKLDECQGTITNNGSVTTDSFTATLSGSIVIGGSGSQTAVGTCTSSGAWFNGVSGKINNSLSFDGTDDYITVPDSNFFDQPGSMSVSSWVYLDTNKNYNQIFTKGVDSSENYELFVRSTGQIEGAWVFNTGRTTCFASTRFLSTSTWYHVVAVFESGSSCKMYIDGKLDSVYTFTATSVTTNTGALIIGGDTSVGGRYLDGKMDEFQLYNYPLSADQVKHIYNNGAAFFGPATGSP